MFNGFHHIGLRVQDMEKSLAFYTDGLGGQLVHQFPMGGSGRPIYLIDLGGNAVVELIPGSHEGPQQSQRWLHIAVRTEDTTAAFDRAIAAGAREKIAPNDGNLGTMAVRTAFVFGPDDEEIEFFQVR